MVSNGCIAFFFFSFSIWYTASEQVGKVKVGSGIQRQEFVDGDLECTHTL